jgi:hypothetical protein
MIGNMRSALLLLIAVRTASCCEIVQTSLKQAVRRSEIVFRGSIEDVTTDEIVFRVKRVWKGHVPATCSMPKVISGSSPCSPGFYQHNISVGTELLVFARRMPQFNIDGYLPEPGSHTALIQDAHEDLKKLGNGHPPR